MLDSQFLTGWLEGLEAMAEVDTEAEVMAAVEMEAMAEEVEEGALGSSGVAREEEVAAPTVSGMVTDY